VEPIPRGARIPLLTLQPLLENAVYHGIQPLPEGGTVSVGVKFPAGRAQIRITNPMPAAGAGRAVTSQALGNRMALANIRDRLAALHGDAARLETAAQDGLFVTTLDYPLAATAAEADQLAAQHD